MIIVREHFVAKPGQAGKLAALLKEVMAIAAPGKARILTDLTGQFNRVIMVSKYDNLAAWEQSWEKWKQPSLLIHSMA